MHKIVVFSWLLFCFGLRCILERNCLWHFVCIRPIYRFYFKLVCNQVTMYSLRQNTWSWKPLMSISICPAATSPTTWRAIWRWKATHASTATWSSTGRTIATGMSSLHIWNTEVCIHKRLGTWLRRCYLPWKWWKKPCLLLVKITLRYQCHDEGTFIALYMESIRK